MAAYWTDEEVEFLCSLYEQIGPKWFEIGEALDRSPDSVRGKWRTTGRTKKVPKKENLNQVKVNVQGNYMEAISSPGRRIMNVDDLIEVCGVNMDEWYCDHHIVNKWEVGAKTSFKDLTWEGGSIVKGKIEDSGNLTIAPLIQVKGWFVKKVPISITPVISPINIALPKINNNKPIHDDWGYQTALVLPDTQIGFTKDLRTNKLIPYHDRTAIDIAVQIVGDNYFDDIVILGDWVDLSEWTDKFIRSPEFYFTTQSAIIEAFWWLYQLRFSSKNPDVDIYYVEGNHDMRMQDSMVIHLIYAYQLKPATQIDLDPALSIPTLLETEKLGVNWVDGYPDNQVWLNDNVLCEHGYITRAKPGATAQAVVSESNVSRVFGHIHKRESATRPIYDRDGSKTITAMSPGCLCKTDGSVPGHNLNQNWSQGLSVVYYEEEGYHSIEPIPIEDGRAVWNKKVYEGIDRIDEISSQMKWEF